MYLQRFNMMPHWDASMISPITLFSLRNYEYYSLTPQNIVLECMPAKKKKRAKFPNKMSRYDVLTVKAHACYH